MAKQKKQGPSCFGTILLLVLIIAGLKIAYSGVLEKPDTAKTEDTFSSEENESLYDLLLRELKAYARSVTIPYDCSEELFDTYKRVCDDHPELFWVNGSGRSEKITAGTDVTVTLYPDIPLTLVEILQFRQELEEKKEEILGSIDPAADQYKKIRYVHDYLITHTEYDSLCAAGIDDTAGFDAYWQSSSAYGCLVQGKAICSGYAAAFQMLLAELGIPCIRVSGHERESGVAHEWNCVKLGERWYYVDVTWDDPVYESENAYFKDDITYEYCMITEEMLNRTHCIDSKESVPVCDDDSYFYYKNYGKYLGLYDYPSAASMITAQLERGENLALCFADRAEAEKAAQALFEGEKFYDIAAVMDMESVKLTYSIGKNGLLRIALLQ